jgi:5'-methylthioadenosine phosphorylase
MNTQPKLAIIGGSGIYDAEMFEGVEEVRLHTPFGSPSGPVQVGKFKDLGVAFLPRHGKGHTHPPHKVNYRANIWALRELGVERTISVCAVGSLKEELMPGDIVVPDQFIDFTKKRDYTFYDGGRTVHISTADPFCPQLRSAFTHDRGPEVLDEGREQDVQELRRHHRHDTESRGPACEGKGDVLRMSRNGDRL